MSSRGRPWSLLPCVALMVVYLAMAAKHLLGGDNAEFVTVGTAGGVAHPPGYPLYVLWLRATSWLPAASPVHRASIATGLCGVAALVLLTRASRAWGASEGGAALASVVFGATGLALRLATAAEVFMLNAALAAAILLVAAPAGPLRGAKRSTMLGLLAGLALANHHSAVLVAPIGLWGVWAGLREAPRRGRAAVLAVGALLLGLLPYGLLMIDARRATASALVWGDTTTVAGIWRHFTRSDFGTTTLGRFRTPAAPSENLLFLVRNLGRQTHVLPIVMAVFGGVAVARRDSGNGRAGPLLVITTLLVGPLFVLRFNIPLTGLGGSVVERFHLLPLLFVALLAGVGMTPALARFPRPGISVPSVIAVVLAASVAVAVPDLSLEHEPTIENYLHDTLASAPPGSVLLGSGDHRTFGFAYLQGVLHERPDVDYVDVHVLTFAWSAERVRSRLGIALADPDGRVDQRMVAARVLGTGRPVLVADMDLAEIIRAFPTYPQGTTLRVLPKGDKAPAPAETEQMNVEIFAQFHTSPPAPEGSWARSVRMDYARAWLMIADAYDRRGMPEAAARNRARAAPYERLR